MEHPPSSTPSPVALPAFGAATSADPRSPVPDPQCHPRECLPSRLSPDDEDLIAFFLTSHEEPLLIARKKGMSLDALFAWESRPEIRKAFSDYRALQRRLTAPIRASAYRTILTNLVQLSRDTTDPVELRRTSALLLRTLRPPRRRIAALQTAVGAAPQQSRAAAHAPSPSLPLTVGSATGRGGRVFEAGSSAGRAPDQRRADLVAALLAADGSIDRAKLDALADQIDRELDEPDDQDLDEYSDDTDHDAESLELDDNQSDNQTIAAPRAGLEASASKLATTVKVLNEVGDQAEGRGAREAPSAHLPPRSPPDQHRTSPRPLARAP